MKKEFSQDDVGRRFVFADILPEYEELIVIDWGFYSPTDIMLIYLAPNGLAGRAWNNNYWRFVDDI